MSSTPVRPRLLPHGTGGELGGTGPRFPARPRASPAFRRCTGRPRTAHRHRAAAVDASGGTAAPRGRALEGRPHTRQSPRQRLRAAAAPAENAGAGRAAGEQGRALRRVAARAGGIRFPCESAPPAVSAPRRPRGPAGRATRARPAADPPGGSPPVAAARATRWPPSGRPAATGPVRPVPPRCRPARHRDAPGYRSGGGMRRRPGGGLSSGRPGRAGCASRSRSPRRGRW